MKSTSIAAYELPARVASYDADMDVMHPNRHKMVSVALETLPFDPSAAITALDLGTGTGFFTDRFLKQFPQARVISVDGSNSMVDLARTRLGPLTARVDFRIGDFRQLQDLIPESAHGDAVFSSYALHHLNHDEKREVIRQALRFLKPGGWLINADIVTHESKVIEERIQQLRVEGIVRRGHAIDRQVPRCHVYSPVSGPTRSDRCGSASDSCRGPPGVPGGWTHSQRCVVVGVSRSCDRRKKVGAERPLKRGQRRKARGLSCKDESQRKREQHLDRCLRSSFPTNRRQPPGGAATAVALRRPSLRRRPL